MKMNENERSKTTGLKIIGELNLKELCVECRLDLNPVFVQTKIFQDGTARIDDRLFFLCENSDCGRDGLLSAIYTPRNA
ncbi:MAG: hypothetical protein NVS3B29_00700 [Candidatus Saccharimonadales bacterium]